MSKQIERELGSAGAKRNPLDTEGVASAQDIYETCIEATARRGSSTRSVSPLTDLRDRVGEFVGGLLPDLCGPVRHELHTLFYLVVHACNQLRRRLFALSHTALDLKHEVRELEHCLLVLLANHTDIVGELKRV